MSTADGGHGPVRLDERIESALLSTLPQKLGAVLPSYVAKRVETLLLAALRQNIEGHTGQLALESLWALNLCGGLTDEEVLDLWECLYLGVTPIVDDAPGVGVVAPRRNDFDRAQAPVTDPASTASVSPTIPSR